MYKNSLRNRKKSLILTDLPQGDESDISNYIGFTKNVTPKNANILTQNDLDL